MPKATKKKQIKADNSFPHVGPWGNTACSGAGFQIFGKIGHEIPIKCVKMGRKKKTKL